MAPNVNLGSAGGSSWISGASVGRENLVVVAWFCFHFLSFWYRISWLVPGKVVFLALDVFLF